ncbi:type VI secretion system-associated protein TagF [Pseudomonas sp. RIT-PI-AD]|uniref:type VI secretion system-associated protein TagF n=1 Tax=Pseudomonas sp. RIT-PI-AD TaxID=3035294 RepID=UPI0021DB1199|nr:type VI secretion system-associated protein TagF [Pseudomonas sp. RIT-PI-AD]
MEEEFNLLGELAATPRFGFYGKMPAVGDFVVRGLPRAQVALVDHWLQEGLGTLQQTEADWLQHYLIAPAWCFVLPPGQWDEQALCGALIPSVDRVGRYFPLVALAPLSAAQATDQAGLCARLADLAKALPRVLHEGLDPDAFLLQLEALGSWLSLTPGAVPSIFERFQWEGDCSLWWAITQPDQPFRQVSHRGKPDIDLFKCLFGPRLY